MAGSGQVWLVGAGPGDPELITVRGLRLLQAADVVLHDRLAPSALLAEARTDAIIVNVGKSPGQSTWTQADICASMIDHAGSGRSVVRLKGGDPFLFGRGYEEVAACARANIPCGVIPGVSSALAGPASVGIPLTHRDHAHALVILTGASIAGGAPPHIDYEAVARIDTIVLLMARANAAELCHRLLEAGRSPDTPATCIEHATTAGQRTVSTTLHALPDALEATGIGAPMVMVIGPTAGFAGCTELPDEL